MTKISWTPFALRCLDEIHDYVAEESKSFTVADKFIDLIFERTGQLAEFPDSGQEEPLLKRIGRSGRYLVEGHYKIIYQYHQASNEIIITDIFHTSQDPNKLQQ